MTNENDAYEALIAALVRWRLAWTVTQVQDAESESAMEAQLALAWACVREAEGG